MKIALVVAVLVAGLMWAWGDGRPVTRDRLHLRGHQDGRILRITVVAPPLAAPRWLSVHLCSADLHDDAAATCSGQYERESTFEMDGRRSQYLIEWRDVPASAALITAMAFDAERVALASGQIVLFVRG